MGAYRLLLLICYSAVSLRSSESGLSELSMINQCTCVGFNLIYECTVVAESGATVWRGTAIGCPEIGYEIFLRHSSSVFMQRRGCDSGDIFAYGVRIEENCYTSQLSILISDPSMNNNSVKCLFTNGTSIAVGLSFIEITKDPLPPPNDTTISHIMEDSDGSVALTFTWTPVILNCPNFHYIIASNCGVCPNTTTATTVVCSGPGMTLGERCTFEVQSVVCGIIGNSSSVSVELKVPDAPAVNVVPTYSHTTGSLFEITTIFSELEKFNITYGLDGSAVNYSVVYTDAESEVTCRSITFPTSTCGPDGICKHIQGFPLSNCPHPVNIQVNVFGTNLLKNGASNNFTIGSYDTV